MIKLSLKSLADYITANHARQRKILRDCKYPDTDEASAKIWYYREARDAVTGFHRGGHEQQWLLDRADNLRVLTQSTTGPVKKRLQHNARAIQQYATNCSDRVCTVEHELRLHIDFGHVRITARPDLHITERSKTRVIKLEFGVDAPAPDEIKIISQGLYEAAKGVLPAITNRSVIYLDVPRSLEHFGARAGSRTLREMEAACQNIEAVWPTL